MDKTSLLFFFFFFLKIQTYALNGEQKLLFVTNNLERNNVQPADFICELRDH